MSEDHKYLRLSLLPEHIRSLTYNLARDQHNIAYFDHASIFVSNDVALPKQPEEILRTAGAITGNWTEHQWQGEVKPVDFYVVKGIVEGLFETLKLTASFEQVKIADMHPGRTALIKLNETVVGFLGQIHPLL